MEYPIEIEALMNYDDPETELLRREYCLEFCKKCEMRICDYETFKYCRDRLRR